MIQSEIEELKLIEKSHAILNIIKIMYSFEISIYEIHDQLHVFNDRDWAPTETGFSKSPDLFHQ